MQSIFNAEPTKVVVIMVGRTKYVIQCLQEASHTLVKKYIDSSTGLDSERKSIMLETTDGSIWVVIIFLFRQ